MHQNGQNIIFTTNDVNDYGNSVFVRALHSEVPWNPFPDESDFSKCVSTNLCGR